MRALGASLAITAAAMTMTFAVPAAWAYPYHHYRCVHHHVVAGTVIGAVTGGLIGNVLTHGHGPGTLIGAGAGALVGNAAARHNAHC
jgi:hypothetical protein